MNMLSLPALIYPTVTLKIRQDEDKRYSFFDTFRRKWIALKPEEYVRNQLLYFLVINKKFPYGLLSVEREFKLYQTRKRYDAVFYKTNRTPFVLIECKSWTVPLGEDELMQLWRYNLELQAPFLILSNGLIHFFMSSKGILSDIPTWSEIQNNTYG